jgi:hypothetical protein
MPAKRDSIRLFIIQGLSPMLPELAPEEVASAVEGVAAEALFVHEVAAPPVDALALAGRMGLTLAWDDRQRGRARLVRLSAGGAAALPGAILLRPEPRAERRQWAVAHEIGEHLSERVFATLDIDPAAAPSAARETIANRLASALLLPAAWFVVDGPACGWELPALKRRYATASHELIARRMLDAPPPVIVTIYDQGRITLRGSNQPGRPPRPSAAESRCQAAAHARIARNMPATAHA